MNFINNGTDEEILKSLPTENISEDLIKAMNKQGLVQKEVQVRTKNGMITRKQWVKAGQDQPAVTKTSKQEDTLTSASGVKYDPKSLKQSDEIDSKFEKENSKELRDMVSGGVINEVSPYPGQKGYTYLNYTDKDGKNHTVSLKASTKKVREILKTAQTQSKKNTSSVKESKTKESKSSPDFTVPTGADSKKQIQKLMQDNNLSSNDIMKQAKKQGISWKESSDNYDNWTNFLSTVNSASSSSTQTITTPKDKNSLLQMLQSGTSREDIMSQAEKDGVIWKHSDHPGINWMRASMAMTGTSTKGSAKEDKKQVTPEIKLDTKDLDLSGDFYSVTETAKQFDLGAQVALCKKLGIDPDKFTVIQPEEANDSDSFDKLANAVSKQVKDKDIDRMDFDDNDPDADGVGYQMYKKFNLNGKTCVALYDEGMVSYMIPNEIYNSKTSGTSVISSDDYTKLTTDDEAGTPEGEAHNMVVGRLKSKLSGKTPTETNIKSAAADLATATKHYLIMSARKEDIEHNIAMLNQFNKLAGNNYTMTHEDVLKDILSSQSGASLEERGSAVNKIMNEGGSNTYYNDGNGGVFSSNDNGAAVTIQPTARGNFKVSFAYSDGAKRSETYDKIDAVKTASEKFLKSN